jgi:DNA integrity scanning protein DisA with diadenylate cyclase activity
VTHKEKQRLNEKLRQDRKRAVVLVEQYNKLRQYGSLHRAELTIKQIEDATFPWASEHGGGNQLAKHAQPAC